MGNARKDFMIWLQWIQDMIQNLFTLEANREEKMPKSLFKKKE